LYPASALNGLGALPLIGRYFRARLFLTIRKATMVEDTERREIDAAGPPRQA
jgi:hypothetical protein